MSESAYPSTPYPLQEDAENALAAERVVGAYPEFPDSTGAQDMSRTESQRESDAAVMTILGLKELPNQTLTRYQHEVFGRRIALGDKGAVDVFLMHRLRQIMSIAKARFDRQTPAVNLSIEDQFQNTFINSRDKIGKYTGMKKRSDGSFLSFREYSGLNFAWLMVRDENMTTEEKKALPMTKMAAVYDKLQPDDQTSLAAVGFVNLDELKKTKGTGTRELIEAATVPEANSIINEALEASVTTVKGPRNINIIEHRYGLNGKPELTYRAIGKKFDLTPQGVISVEKSFLKTLGSTAEAARDSFDEVPEMDHLQGPAPSQYQIQRARNHLAALLDGEHLSQTIQVDRDERIRLLELFLENVS